MEHDESDLVGQPLEDVPKRDADEDCNARRSDDGRFVGYCNRTAGWGTDDSSGRCRTHGAEGGAPEDNTNAVTHGAYADCNSYYQSVLNDRMRQFVDDVFEDYYTEYTERHGKPILGIEAELFRLSVTHAKDIGLDKWADEKPEELESGHPLVDKETRKKSVGDDYGESTIIDEHRYRESVVAQAQKRLSTDRRQWLKDLGLLEDPESQKTDALTDLKDAWKASAQGDGS
jgi:hypothetical protein